MIEKPKSIYDHPATDPTLKKGYEYFGMHDGSVRGKYFERSRRGRPRKFERMARWTDGRTNGKR